MYTDTLIPSPSLSDFEVVVMASLSNLATSSCFLYSAICRGVSPSVLRTSTLAPGRVWKPSY